MDELSNLRQLFLDEATDLLEGTERSFLSLESAPDDPATIDQIFRLAHSLKGSAKAVEYGDLASFTHALESLLVKVKKQEVEVNRAMINLLLKCNDHLKEWIVLLKSNPNGKKTYEDIVQELEAASSRGKASVPVPKPENQFFTEVKVTDPTPVHDAPKITRLKAENPKAVEATGDDSIRVKLNKVDDLVNEVGELVILQTVLKQQKMQIQSDLIQKTIDQLSKITRRIQDNSLRLRMIPLKSMFQKMQRIVRDTSNSLEKEVLVHLIGEDIELDKTMVDKLSDPLVHLVRNAVDHGIEATAERLHAGKPAQAKIWLTAQHQGGRLMIEVRDDGKGIDPVIIRKKAIEKGILAADSTMPDEAAIHLIFEPGFSTKAEITEFSGRGVGLDVVKTNINEMKGEIQITSVPGQGTTFRIYLPMTLAIIEGIVIKLNDAEKYVIPMFQVKEIVEIKDSDVWTMGQSNNVFVLHGQTVPVYNLGKILNRPYKTNPKRTVAIVIEVGQKQHAFLVEQVINQQQVVIKKLGPDIGKIRGISGSAILGDGKAAPILDLDEIVTERYA
jgi:two-component system chemotaxis sensor kinase CheA